MTHKKEEFQSLTTKVNKKNKKINFKFLGNFNSFRKKNEGQLGRITDLNAPI